MFKNITLKDLARLNFTKEDRVEIDPTEMYELSRKIKSLENSLETANHRNKLLEDIIVNKTKEVESYQSALDDLNEKISSLIKETAKTAKRNLVLEGLINRPTIGTTYKLNLKV